jgi:hypothetical protein
MSPLIKKRPQLRVPFAQQVRAGISFDTCACAAVLGALLRFHLNSLIHLGDLLRISSN